MAVDKDALLSVAEDYAHDVIDWFTPVGLLPEEARQKTHKAIRAVGNSDVPYRAVEVAAKVPRLTIIGMQRLLNVGGANIKEDGIVGPETVAAFRKVPGFLQRAATEFVRSKGHDMNKLLTLAAPVATTVAKTGVAVATGPARFLATLVPLAVEEERRTGLSAALTVTQAALESAWGTSRSAMEANNLFGIKVAGNPKWTGKSVNMRTREVYNGRTVHENASWRVYPSWADAVRGRSDFLQQNPRYSRAGLFNKGVLGNPLLELEALARAGYATDPAYVRSIKGVLDGRTFRSGVAALGYTLDGLNRLRRA